MTPQEALTELKASIEGCGFQCHMETYKMAISALEKNIPKKPLKAHGGAYRCPNCQMKHFNPDWIGTKCCDCGQALDWSDDK